MLFTFTTSSHLAMKSIRAYLVAAAVIIASPETITHAVEPPLGDPPLVNEVPNNCGISISADQNWLSVNDNDDNNDEIWDFETESKTSGAEPVVGEKDTLKITVTGTADKSEATVTVSIDTGSDKIDGFWEGTLTISGQSPTGTELDGQEKRTPKKTTFTFTVPKGSSATQTLYIEGIKHSDSLKDVKINARIEAPAGITPDPDNRPFRASSLAATPLEITVYQVDLDVDSNNNEGTEFTSGSDEEDKIEASEKEDANGSKRPGKIVIPSSQTNSDGDDVPDFADGFNLPFMGTVNELAQVSQTLKFVPVQVELKAPFDTASAKVKFTYGPVSKPELSEEGIGVTGAGTPEDPYVFNLNKGGMRLWKKKATERTSGEAVPDGDFIPAYTEINWSDIATDISTPRIAKLYLEYVDKSTPEAAGLKPITVTVTGNGETTDDQVNVTLLPVDLAVDANRDGNVEFGIDQTTSAHPYRFWINNDRDVTEDVEVPGSTEDSADGVVITQRDLEDFSRIQLMVGGFHDQLKNGDIQVTMKFKSGSVVGNPAINLMWHRDEDGDLDYLHDSEIALRHLYSGLMMGKVDKNSGYTFDADFWTGNNTWFYEPITTDKPYRNLLFEGLSEGKGELVLEFKKGNDVLGETCSCWINLLDVRKMYQRAKVTPDDPDDFTEPSAFVGAFNNPTITPPVPNIGWVWDPNGKDFIEDPEEEKEYLVFVHGWNMTYEGSQKYAETMFKRLWQTGYKGRFAFVRWPTYSGVFTYNASDYRAWLSGKGVAAFVNSLPSSYVRNIAAHSMGNVVVSSALREGMQVENYALLNAAIPAMCYDGREALYEFDRETPDGDADLVTKALGFKEKMSQTNGARLINFYLSNDSALTGKINVPIVGDVFGWEDNNAHYKPESFNLGTTGYDYDPDRTAGTKVYLTFLTEFGRHLRSSHESAAYATASRTKTVGADGRTAGVINDKVDMDVQYGFGETHSAEWQWRIQKTHRFYHDLMDKLDLNPIP
jgi:esterase/lipase superfamily enzyme